VKSPVADGPRRALSAAELGVLRADLLEQRRFRAEQLRELAGPVTDRADRASARRAASQAAVRVQLAAAARMVLADVEAALERMAAGRYGWCAACEAPVEPEYLRIVPQARYCLGCRGCAGGGG
jgi:RNA polymerase-binding transcription factor DksA